MKITVEGKRGSKHFQKKTNECVKGNTPSGGQLANEFIRSHALFVPVIPL